MKRIGIYLSFPPEGGGAFQYAQSVLSAASHLPRSDFELVVVHAHSAWGPLVARAAPHARQVPVSIALIHTAIEKLLRAGLSARWWRKVALLLDPVSRVIAREECTAWIFPAQDVMTYAFPGTTIGVIHDLMHLHESGFPEVSRWGLRRRRDRHYANLSNHAAAILVDSPLGKAHVQAAYTVSADKIHALPFAAPSYIHEPEPEDFDQRYSLPSKFIFYPAQFWTHKNHVRLIEALAIARQTAPDLALVLVGSRKNGFKAAESAISRLDLGDAVHIMGYVPDAYMRGFYARALALVMPTFFGPTNIPPLEAMTTGCPVAVSNIYAMPEQIGNAGLTFDPMSVDDIADALVRLATDEPLRCTLVQRGLARANTWQQVHFDKRFRNILESVLGES